VWQPPPFQTGGGSYHQHVLWPCAVAMRPFVPRHSIRLPLLKILDPPLLYFVFFYWRFILLFVCVLCLNWEYSLTNTINRLQCIALHTIFLFFFFSSSELHFATVWTGSWRYLYVSSSAFCQPLISMPTSPTRLSSGWWVICDRLLGPTSVKLTAQCTLLSWRYNTKYHFIQSETRPTEKEGYGEAAHTVVTSRTSSCCKTSRVRKL